MRRCKKFVMSFGRPLENIEIRESIRRVQGARYTVHGQEPKQTESANVEQGTDE